jgi:hypothetical protein
LPALQVSCGQCGGPVGVPAGTRFLTCAQCGSRLELLQGEGAWYTMVLGGVNAPVDQVDRTLTTVELQNEVEPSTGTVVVGLFGLIGSVVIVTWVLGRMDIFGPTLGLFVVAVVGAVTYQLVRALRSASHNDDYVSRRTNLVHGSHSLENPEPGGSLPSSDGASPASTPRWQEP